MPPPVSPPPTLRPPGRIGTRWRALALLALLAAGCATPGGPESDRLEPFNRAMFGFNDRLERHVMRPVATGYRKVVPEPARDGLHHFLRNLETPVILANDLLQGELRRAGETLGRFLVNSTLGVGGVYELGERFGMEYHDEDFGQTLAVWGVPQGPYLVLPFLGSSSVRAGVGMAADSWLSPFGLWLDQATRLTLSAVKTVDSYSRVMDDLAELRESSLDYYAAVRSVYLQHRAEEIRNGRADPRPSQTGIDYDVDYELDDDIDYELDDDVDYELDDDVDEDLEDEGDGESERDGVDPALPAAGPAPSGDQP